MRPTAAGFLDPDEEPSRGSLDQAIQSCLKVLEEDPANLQIRHRVIKYATQKGAYDIVIFQWMDVAEIHALAGENAASMRCYETILSLEDTLQLSPGVRADAVQVLRQLVAQVKPEIYLHLGEYQLEQGSLQSAERYLRKSIELKPELWNTHFALGKCLLEAGRNTEAITEFQEMLRVSQGDYPDGEALAREWLAKTRE